MNKFLLVCLLILIGLPSIAQKKSINEKAAAKTEEMQKVLQLSKEQQTKLYEVHVKAYTSIAEYDAKKPSKKLKKKQKDIVQKLRDDQYKKILTAAQYKKYKDYKKLEKEEEKKKSKELEKELSK
jgi:hypothetical protein